MARLTKPKVKISIFNSIVGNGTGLSQLIQERPTNEAARRVIFHMTCPGGSMLQQKLSGVSSSNVFGEEVATGKLSPEMHDPLFVSIDPMSNPFSSYIIDKVSEGVASSHQLWQDAQRVRGRARPHDNGIQEELTFLPFQTEPRLDDLADIAMYGFVMDTGQKDFSKALEDIPSVIDSISGGLKDQLEMADTVVGKREEEKESLVGSLKSFVSSSYKKIKKVVSQKVSAATNGKMFESFMGKLQSKAEDAQKKGISYPPGFSIEDIRKAEQAAAVKETQNLGISYPSGFSPEGVSGQVEKTKELVTKSTDTLYKKPVFGDVGKYYDKLKPNLAGGLTGIGSSIFSLWGEMTDTISDSIKKVILPPIKKGISYPPGFSIEDIRKAEQAAAKETQSKGINYPPGFSLDSSDSSKAKELAKQQTEAVASTQYIGISYPPNSTGLEDPK